MSVRLPKEVTALALHPRLPHLVLVASEDRSLRLYDLGTGRMLSAIVHLPDEVSSVVFQPLSPGAADDDGWGAVWIACGTTIHYLLLPTSPFLRNFEDAVEKSHSVAQEDVNDLSISQDGRTLAWASDDGKLGILNIKTGSQKLLRGKHDNIAGNITFLASKPDSLISTSYDSTVKIWITSGGTLFHTQRLDSPRVPDPLSITPPMAPMWGLSLSTYSSASQEPLVCVGTADGAVWLSSAFESPKGETENGMRKRLKGKWRRDFTRVEVAMGPIVGVVFLPPAPSSSPSSPPCPLPRLLTCTHLGTITLFSVYFRTSPSDSAPSRPTVMNPRLRPVSSWQTNDIKKCTAMVANGERIVVGGLGDEGEGRLESWDI